MCSFYIQIHFSFDHGQEALYSDAPSSDTFLLKAFFKQMSRLFLNGLLALALVSKSCLFLGYHLSFFIGIHKIIYNKSISCD
jgi:hypothetical protein